MTPIAIDRLSNAALVDRFRQDDHLAFAELFRRHRDLVYAVCLRWLGHHQDAEDVTQETFRRLVSSIDRWDATRPLEPWLVTIAGNRCRTVLSRRRGELTGVDWSDRSAIAPLDHSSPSEGAMLGELERFLESLPAEVSEAFNCVHRKGWTYEQVSRATGHPVGTIKVWVHRARLKLIDKVRPPLDETTSTPALSLQSRPEVRDAN